MEQKYYSIKVTISPLGDGFYRSRISPQSSDGSNFGAGNDFQLLGGPVDPHQFSQKLSTGDVSRETVVGFGKWLFETVFHQNVRNKYHELKAIAGSRKLTLRICLALHSPELINIPWEVFHDESNFLIKHGYPVVRVLDELVGAKSSFAPIRTVLIAAANPKSADYEAFDAGAHIKDIETKLQGSAVHAQILPSASRQGLLEKIRSGGFDALYFVGHGEASELGGRLICEEDGTAAPDPLEASDLAGALREVNNLRFVYLNSCSSAKTAKDNPFQGVAQRLMLDGDVAAVAAMQVDVGQPVAMEMAKTFFGELKSGYPEEAMHIARTGAKDDGHSFAIPALYSYLDAPDQFERNNLESFLSANDTSKYIFVLPTFYSGVPANKPQPEDPKDGQYRYRGETFARGDMEAALSVINLLAIVIPPSQIVIYPLDSGLPSAYSHAFLFGSKSNRIVAAVQKEFSDKFEFEYGPEKWSIKDKEFGQEYAVIAPNTLNKDDYRDATDYGVIQKIRAGDRIYFAMSGLGSRATQGCGWYLFHKWRGHIYNAEDFAVLLKFPGGLDFSDVRVIDRRTGKAR